MPRNHFLDKVEVNLDTNYVLILKLMNIPTKTTSAAKVGPAAGHTAQITAELQADIDSGRLLPGDALDERLLSARFNVSRTPIREALQRLAASGLVRIVPRQGVFVSRMSLPELREMYEMLAELEGAVARLCASRMQEPWLSALQKAVDEGQAASDSGDWLAYAQTNADFHQALYEGCRNRPLAEQCRLTRRRVQVYRVNAFQQPGRMQESAREHAELAAVIRAGDGDKARSKMLLHLDLGGTGFGEFVSGLPESMFSPYPHEMAYPTVHPIER